MHDSFRFICVILIAAAGCCAIPRASAQDETEYSKEIGASAGIIFNVNDANSKMLGGAKPAGGAVLKFILNPRMAVKTSLTYGGISGNTSKVKNFYPAVVENPMVGEQHLQYSFSGSLVDFTTAFELNFLPYGFQEGFQGFRRLTPYICMGAGFLYSTSGKAFSFHLPIGAGLKYKAGRRLNLALEWMTHFTPNDKLDGLEAPLGIKSSGFKNKDFYSTMLFSITYDISPNCPNCNKDNR